jgi:hypothetical protein
VRSSRQEPSEPDQSEGVFLTLIQRLPGRSLCRRGGPKSPVRHFREVHYALAECSHVALLEGRRSAFRERPRWTGARRCLRTQPLGAMSPLKKAALIEAGNIQGCLQARPAQEPRQSAPIREEGGALGLGCGRFAPFHDPRCSVGMRGHVQQRLSDAPIPLGVLPTGNSPWPIAPQLATSAPGWGAEGRHEAPLSPPRLASPALGACGAGAADPSGSAGGIRVLCPALLVRQGQQGRVEFGRAPPLPRGAHRPFDV